MFLAEYSEISFADFNQEFFDSLDDNRYVQGPAVGEEQYFHTVMVDGVSAGIVGYLPPKNVSLSDTGFVQVLLKSEYRGRGLMGKAYELLAERHELKTLYATIKKSNLHSIRAHQKVGFELLPEDKMENLRNRKLLTDYEIRLEKEVV
ncbi:MAG: GNAT family N-acetyltransferase [Candidatus Vogelbacteria bacterium]|nr:GNAT family N-acetyltransferase [Candidatus Vogelbacteria bacterium]